MSGIYAIVNIANGHKYIGGSTDPRQRMNQHFGHLRAGTHHSKQLQEEFSQFGEKLFTRTILEECEQEVLAEREAFWHTALGNDYGLHVTETNNKGTPWTPAQRENQSLLLRRICENPEVRARLAETSRKGWENNREERIQALKDAWTEEKRKEMSEQVKARPGNREQLREAAQYWKTPEGRERRSEWAKRRHEEGTFGVGKKHTREDIAAKLAESGWELRDLEGVRMKDKALVYCPKHDHEQRTSIRDIIHSGRGCRECGWDRVRKSKAA